MYDVIHDGTSLLNFFRDDACSTVTGTTYTRLDWINTREGVENPSWRDQIAHHQGATTFFRGSKTSVYGMQPSIWNRAGGTDCFEPDPPPGRIVPRHYRTVCIGVPWGISPSDVPLSTSVASVDVTNQALTNFWKQAKAARSEFQTGVFFGELKETLHQLKHPAEAMLGHFGRYVRFVGKRGPRIIRRLRKSFVRQTWLEYSFGLKPLVADVAAAARALAKLRTRIDEFKRVSGKATESLVLSDATTDLQWNQNLLMLQQRRLETNHCLVKVYGLVKTGVENNLPFEAAAFGLLPEDFFPTLYELIPFSWLFDYFSNLGDVIAAYSQCISYVNWAATTVRSQRRIDFSGKPLTQGVATFQRSIEYDVVELVPFRINRTDVTRIPGLPVQYYPSLRFRVPGMSTKWLNLGALFGSARNVSSLLRK